MASPEAVRLYKIIRNTPKQVDLDLLHQREAGEPPGGHDLRAQGRAVRGGP
jgi:hypothetical protein